MRTQVSIELPNAQETSLSFAAAEVPKTANISNPTKIFSVDEYGARGFQLSEKKSEVVSTLDGKYLLYSDLGFSGYVSSALSDAQGNFQQDVSFSFRLSYERPAYLFIVFDPVAKEFATAFSLQYGSTKLSITNNTSTVYIVDTAALKLPMNNNSSKITVSIQKWSSAYKSAKLFQIFPALIMSFTGKDLKSFTCSENATNTQLSISPGVIEQYADITVYDREGLLRKLAALGLLVEDMKVEIVACEDNCTALGSYTVSNWNVDTTSASIKIECRDQTSKLSKVNIPGAAIQDRTLHNMLTYVFNCLGNVAWGYFDAATQIYCRNIYTPNSWSYAAPADKVLAKLCTLGMLRIYYWINKYVVMRCY